MAKRQDSIPGYLYPLDGLRAISVILIFIFHTWQQSWIFYSYTMPNGFKLFDFTLLQRYGYLAIDFFFVLSGFGLFYPIARSMFGESQFKGWKDFFIKRARRIYPAYVVIMILLLFIPSAIWVLYDKSNILENIKHIITNLLFIENFTDKNGVTPIISTAWTLPMEVHFYILFPLICIPFRKKPVLTFIGMVIASLLVRFYSICFTDMRQFYQTFTTGYFDVFGAGMLSAYFVVYARHKMKNAEKMKPFITAISVICLIVMYCFFKWLSAINFPQGSDGSVYFRFLYRGILAIATGGFIFTACFSYDFWQKKIWGNRLFIFISSISYSVYLLHQNVYIFLKANNIPHSDMDPVMNDRPAMWGLTFICLGVTLALSILITRFVEQPIAKYGYKGCFGKILSFFYPDKPENKKIK